MELKEQAPATTLGRKLGDTAHLSGLAIRLSRLSGARECPLEWLLKVAVERGAKHYARDFDPTLPPDHPIELTLYGRGALALGCPAHERRHETTRDVDVVIPLGQQANRRSSNCQPLCYLNQDGRT